MFNKSGKTLTIFVVLTIILLSSATCIGFFLYNKEMQQRKVAESEREASRELEAKLQGEVKELRKQLVLLEDKNKEADGKINNLLDEMELNEGLRNELKKEKERIKAELNDVAEKLQEYQGLLKAEKDRSKELQQRFNDLEIEKKAVQSRLDEAKSDLQAANQRTPEPSITGAAIPPPPEVSEKVELDKIVVSPQDTVRGRVLSVDKESEFLVCNLGLKHGVIAGNFLSVYRGEEYLGDVKTTRVQEEMSAADIVPPFSSRKVRKNDIVVFKQ